MFTTVRRYELDPSAINEVVRKIKDGFVPIISKAPGFRSYDVVTTQDGVLTSITTYDQRAGAEESNRLAADWIKKNLAGVVPNPPRVTAGELSVHLAK